MSHLIAFFALTLAYAFPDTPMRPSVTLAGEWRGTAKVVQVVMLDRAFAVRLYIHRDGTVTGTVGDASLRDARFFRHRPLGASRDERHELMDYMIRGRLEGPLLAPERVTATEVFIPLDYSHGTLAGAVHAHGTLLAGREFGIFSSDLTLGRLPR